MVDLVIFHSFQWLGPTNSPWFFPKVSRNRIQIGPRSQTLMVLSAQASLDTINRRASLLHQSGGSGGSRFLRMTLMLKPSPLSMGELCVVDMDIINIYIYLFIFICIYNYLLARIYGHTHCLQTFIQIALRDSIQHGWHCTNREESCRISDLIYMKSCMYLWGPFG